MALDNAELYRHCRHVVAVKGSRLQLSVDAAEVVLLERAAAAAHLNVSAFMLQAAVARAEEVLAERPSIRLSPRAAAAFTEALGRPAQANERLAAALDRPRRFSWLD